MIYYLLSRIMQGRYGIHVQTSQDYLFAWCISTFHIEKPYTCTVNIKYFELFYPNIPFGCFVAGRLLFRTFRRQTFRITKSRTPFISQIFEAGPFDADRLMQKLFCLTFRCRIFRRRTVPFYAGPFGRCRYLFMSDLSRPDVLYYV